jgi:hypothetical protein
LQINPVEILSKDVNFFKEAGVTTKVQHIRYNHYQARRLKYLEMLEGVLFGDSGSTLSFVSPRGVTIPLQMPDSLLGGKS